PAGLESVAWHGRPRAAQYATPPREAGDSGRGVAPGDATPTAAEGAAVMTDDELRTAVRDLRDSLQGVVVRLERLDTRLDGLEKGLADVRAEVRPRLEGLENRVARKAATGVVPAGMGALGVLLPVYKSFVYP